MSKKAPKSAKEVRKYNIGDPVLGKMRGYAPWPGIIVDPADAPPAVQRDQPPNKRSTTYCILFFPQGDYGWLTANDLSFLQRREIEAFLADETKKRTNNLRMGYHIALDPAAWMTERAATAAAAQEAEENAQVDQLASDEDEDAAATGDDPEAEEDADADADAMDLDVGLGLVEGKKAKKTKAAPGRKRKRDSDAAESKPTKPAKAKKATEPKAKKTPADKEKKPRKNGANAKNKALVESEDEAAGGDHANDGDAPGGSSKKAARDAATPPPAKKARRDREEEDESKTGDAQSVKVRDWRHKLQKTFLSNKGVPKSEAMIELDTLFTTVEQYDEMTIEQLQFSKIGKVMRHIAALDDDKIPPRDEDFQFRARAKGLVDKWHRILNANKPGGGVTSPISAGPGKMNGGGALKDAAKEQLVEEGVTNLDINGKGADSPAVADTTTVLADLATIVASESAVGGAADAEGEHDVDANAEAEDASTHVEDVVMMEA